MNHAPSIRRLLSVVLVPVSLALASFVTLASTGCAASTSEAAAAVPAKELTRAGAIQSAREDARRSYGSDWASNVDAQYESGFWVINLYATSGYRLRYSISARDGSIRERNMAQ